MRKDESLNVKMDFNGIDIEVNFNPGTHILEGHSGTGKSLLLEAINLFCLNNNKTCRYLNFNNRHNTKETILTICGRSEVVLLDNADLYLTDEILRELKAENRFIIISVKDTAELDISEDNFYEVQYQNQKLRLRKN